jgi:(2R)-3-sulfolactate dehydrogenase (NADP+)
MAPIIKRIIRKELFRFLREGVGLFLVVFRPDALVEDFAGRLSAQLSRLAQAGVRIPGSHIRKHEVDVPEDVMDRVRAYLR